MTSAQDVHICSQAEEREFLQSQVLIQEQLRLFLYIVYCWSLSHYFLIVMIIFPFLSFVHFLVSYSVGKRGIWIYGTSSVKYSEWVEPVTIDESCQCICVHVFAYSISQRCWCSQNMYLLIEGVQVHHPKWPSCLCI